jgi:hypothetical protein
MSDLELHRVSPRWRLGETPSCRPPAPLGILHSVDGKDGGGH